MTLKAVEIPQQYPSPWVGVHTPHKEQLTGTLFPPGLTHQQLDTRNLSMNQGDPQTHQLQESHKMTSPLKYLKTLPPHHPAHHTVPRWSSEEDAPNMSVHAAWTGAQNSQDQSKLLQQHRNWEGPIGDYVNSGRKMTSSPDSDCMILDDDVGKNPVPMDTSPHDTPDGGFLDFLNNTQDIDTYLDMSKNPGGNLTNSSEPIMTVSDMCTSKNDPDSLIELLKLKRGGRHWDFINITEEMVESWMDGSDTEIWAIDRQIFAESDPKTCKITTGTEPGDEDNCHLFNRKTALDMRVRSRNFFPLPDFKGRLRTNKKVTKYNEQCLAISGNESGGHQKKSLVQYSEGVGCYKKYGDLIHKLKEANAETLAQMNDKQ